MIPPSPTGSYDVRDVIRALVDDGELLEVRGAMGAEPRHRVRARSTGARSASLANQPIALAGTLDIPASQKGARFVAFCDAFNLPLVTLVDTPGFYPGKDLEWRGMIRHGAQLVFAYGRATVPRVCVILRKSYGGAYIVMDSKRMGNDLCLAWPWAELAVMGAGQAVGDPPRGEPPPTSGRAFEADYERAAAQPVHRRRARLRRRRDRPRRHAADDRRGARGRSPTSANDSSRASTTTRPASGSLRSRSAPGPAGGARCARVSACSLCVTGRAWGATGSVGGSCSVAADCS